MASRSSEAVSLPSVMKGSLGHVRQRNGRGFVNQTSAALFSPCFSGQSHWALPGGENQQTNAMLYFFFLLKCISSQEPKAGKA